MDRGNISFIALKMNDRNYTMLCDPLSPLDEMREVLKQFDEGIQKLQEELIQAKKDAEAKDLQHAEVINDNS